MDLIPLKVLENTIETTGSVIDEVGEHWKVDCPKCRKELEYTGFFDSSAHYECGCGCIFLTTAIFFDNGYYFE